MNRPSAPRPPRLADKLFTWYCHRANVDDLHGDVEELFHNDLKRHSLFNARLLYWRRILSLIFSYALTSRKNKAAYHHLSFSQINAGMLKNYFKTGSRNLIRNKFFTILNAFALSLGMSISLMFIAFVSFLYRYDDFHSKKDHIYRVTTQLYDRVDNPEYASAPVGVAQKLKEDFTGIEKVVRVQRSLRGDALYGDKKIQLNGYFTDPEFLQVFDFPLTQGDVPSALANPNTIVITQTEATKIFGSKDPLGEMIRMEPYGDFIITGILADVPKNSHMTFGALASYSTLISYKGSSFLEDETGWKEFLNSYIYLLLENDSEAIKVQDYLDRIAMEKYATQDLKSSFKLQSLNDIVPGPMLYNSIGGTWDFTTILMVGAITLIVLVPACSNYIHLSISQSLNRIKEIGVRKVMGGQKTQVFFQFITETTIMMLLALALSYLIFESIRVEFLEMFAEADVIDLAPSWQTYIGFILFALFVGFAAGVIPALYFSKIAPINALKGKLVKSGNSRFSIRKVVITAQFVLSLGFIMAVVIMMQQYRHSVNYDFGFEQENILDVELQNIDPQIFKNEYGKLPSVQRVSASSDILGIGSTPAIYFKTSQEATDSTEASAMSIDENFISNLGLQLLSGRNFGDNTLQNSRMIIVNEEFIKKMEIKDDTSPLEKMVVLSDGREVRIGAVVKNFHYASLRAPIKSFFFEYSPAQFRYANVKIQSSDIVRDMTAMSAVWKKIGGLDVFRAQFFKDEIQEVYSFYFIIIKLWSFLGLLAITVACLGLLGAVVFTIKNRVKEVSIRKVMGASSESVVFLLSKDFIILLAIAGVITTPIIYFMFDYLLVSVQYYSIKIGFLEIFLSFMIMMVLCLATVFSQTMKAANTNPAENLRME